MSVLQCNRNGCDNIMCDYLSDKHGYLCWECRNELLSKRGIKIKDFMRSPKVSEQEIDQDEWERKIDEVFKPRD